MLALVMEEWMRTDGWMGEWMGEWVDEWVDGAAYKTVKVEATSYFEF